MSDENNKKPENETPTIPAPKGEEPSEVEKVLSAITHEELGKTITSFLKFLEEKRVAACVVCLHSNGPAIGANVPHDMAKSILAAGALTLGHPEGPRLGGAPVDGTWQPPVGEPNRNLN